MDGEHADETPPDGCAVGIDEMFTALQNHRRRLILKYVAEHGGASYDELTEVVAADEADVPRSAIEKGSKVRKRAYVGIYQTHVPKLEDNGLIETVGQTNYVNPTDNTDTAVWLIEQGEKLCSGPDAND